VPAAGRASDAFRANSQKKATVDLELEGDVGIFLPPFTQQHAR
jgi:hypothetical protein